MHSATTVLAVLAGLIFAGIALEELFRRTGIPDVLVLLLIGLAVQASGILTVADLRGADRVLTTAALVLILFEGSMELRIKDLRSVLGSTVLLTFVSYVPTAAALTGIGYVLFGLPLLPALLLGNILGGTAPTVVIPVVRGLRVSSDTRAILTVESALGDLFSVAIVLGLLTYMQAGDVHWASIGFHLVLAFCGAVAVGILGGIGWAVGLRELRKRRTSFLAVGAAVFLVYAATETFSHFGVIAVLVFGVVLGNAPSLVRSESKALTHDLELSEGERYFLAEGAFLLKVLFFVYLGLNLNLGRYEAVVFGMLATLAVFVIRPFAVRLGLRPATTSRRDAISASALAPKGLAAAVLASLTVQAGILEGSVIEAITFGAVLQSILLSSALLIALDRPFVADAYSRLFSRYEGPPSGKRVAGSETAAIEPAK